jgi:hypothetical protein
VASEQELWVYKSKKGGNQILTVAGATSGHDFGEKAKLFHQNLTTKF